MDWESWDTIVAAAAIDEGHGGSSGPQSGDTGGSTMVSVLVSVRMDGMDGFRSEFMKMLGGCVLLEVRSFEVGAPELIRVVCCTLYVGAQYVFGNHVKSKVCMVPGWIEICGIRKRSGATDRML